MAVWAPGLGYAEYDPERDDWNQPLQGVTDTVATDAGLLAVSHEGKYIPAALLDPETGEWTDLAVPGGPSCKAYPAPLAVPGGAVIFDCGAGSHFDAQTRQFTELDLPVNPQGGGGNTVRTGQSLLTYVTGCCAGRGPAAPREMVSWEHPFNP